MNLTWYVNRLKKMGLSEIVKRLIEHSAILYDKVCFRDPDKWPYERFAGTYSEINISDIPGSDAIRPKTTFSIYGYQFDLKKPVNWYFSDLKNQNWPKIFP